MGFHFEDQPHGETDDETADMGPPGDARLAQRQELPEEPNTQKNGRGKEESAKEDYDTDEGTYSSMGK